MSISIEIKENNEQYASVDYWNERYTNEAEYDWLGDYNVFKELIHRHVSKSERILMVGCGNSQLSEQMFKDGYEKIVSTDISEVCIANQKKGFPHLTWQVADLMNLKDFSDESFDVVIEKATLDALLVGEKSPWHSSDDAQKTIDSCLSEISRVIKSKNGRFLSLTFAQPHFRTPFYSKPKYSWGVEYETFGTGFHYFCYVMTKGRSELQDQVTVSSAVDISRLTLNANEDYSSSNSDEEFISRLDLSFESDNASVDSIPSDTKCVTELSKLQI